MTGSASAMALGGDAENPGVVFWFRNDLRLHDQVALSEAVRVARDAGGWLLPVFVHDVAWDQATSWGFARVGARRRAWWASALDGLAEQLRQRSSGLLECRGDPAGVLARLVASLGDPLLVCEEIPAPEEQAAVEALRAAGVRVRTVWHSTLLHPEDLPFAPDRVADTFTVFRQAVERAGVRARAPLAEPADLPPLPRVPVDAAWATDRAVRPSFECLPAEPRSSFPVHLPTFHGGERAALAHLDDYCGRGLPHTYKQTRNGLSGVGYSSKWSPWLATGALSPRRAMAAIHAFESAHGANDGTYWLWFELLWRDHFRFLHLKHGRRLYHPGGLTGRPAPSHDAAAFARWCDGRTGLAWIDAGMRELAATGYLSNRMRQNVASHLIHDLGCDWRAGAAWFESRLLDYDVSSNQGNWLYLAGRGTDPRGGRRFDPARQSAEHDPHGDYRRLWTQPT